MQNAYSKICLNHSPHSVRFIISENLFSTSPQPLCLVGQNRTSMIREGMDAASRRRSPSPPADYGSFHLSLLPHDRILKRTLMPWSAHHSVTTDKWIATIPRREPNSQSRHIQLHFRTEREAREFCKSYSPPKPHAGTTCLLCQHPKTVKHCRNCGASICDRCSTKWGAKMVPKTYSASSALFVTVCRSCDWLSNAFCMALLQGRFHDALTLYKTVRNLVVVSIYVYKL
jgi:hypothetical protein